MKCSLNVFRWTTIISAATWSDGCEGIAEGCWRRGAPSACKFLTGYLVLLIH